MAFVRVASVSDIPVGSMKPCVVKHRRIVVVRTEDGWYALDDECTHDGAPISDGKIKGNDEIMCRRHGARFRLSDGAVTAPPALVPLETYEVKIDGEDILVNLD
ncbi:MAG: hypothetical protein D6800_04075 [Candidatus Zixiibacteriota bacterium]|nr:MAG: hypothetical protein D6800_04075 [candidate division Zixibacteria bacterium]